jgi:hypothetical protein
MKALPLLVLVLVGCGASSDEATPAGPAPASLSSSTAEAKKGGSQAMIAPAMQPSAAPAPLEAGSALKGK